MKGLLCGAFLIMLAFSVVHAGGGPTGCVVIYDPNKPTSVSIAARYQALRGIPESNMIPYAFPSTFTRVTAWDFIYALRQTLAARGIDQQLQSIAIAGVAPLNSEQTGPTGIVTSLHSFLYVSPNYSQASFPTSAATNDVLSINKQNFQGPVPNGTKALSAEKSVGGCFFWPTSALSYPGKSGMSPREVLAFLDRTTANDGAKPDGVIYWPLNSDVRSTIREYQIDDVAEVWRERGIRPWITGDGALFNVFPPNRPDIAGGVIGQANFDRFASNTFLPGTWIDHLTSNGGLIDSFNKSQTPATDWLRLGADGSSGTITEPFADSRKFPHAFIQTHLRAGASMVEAFWQSIEIPLEIVCLADPLLQPHADFPVVGITAPADGATVSGSLAILAAAAPTNGKTLEPNLDLFVDGRRIAVGAPEEPVIVSRAPEGFLLNTGSLADGWHDLRVVAYNADAVRTQKEARISILVNNYGQSLALTGPSTVNPAGSAAFTATNTGFFDLVSLELRANGRRLAAVPLSGGTVNLNLASVASLAPLDGTWTLQVMGVRSNGQKAYSPPLTTSVVWPALAATPSPSRGGKLADARFFYDTNAVGFNWDTATPDATRAIEAASNGLYVTPASFPGVTITDYTKRPGYQLDWWFYAAVDDWYEIGFDYDDSRFTQSRQAFIDGQPLLEENFVFQPRRLAPGWHAIRVRTAMSDARSVNWELRIRGGASQEFELVTPALSANSGTGLPGDSPTIVSITSPSPVTGTTTALTATATIGGGTPSELAALTYHWSQLSGPVPATFSANGTNAASATTVTFRASGDYVFGLSVTGPAGSNFSTHSVTVSNTLSASLTLDVGTDVGTSELLLQGDTIRAYAFSTDQFGRRVAITPVNPALPTVQWTSTDPLATITPVSADGGQISYRTLSSSGTFTLTATGTNGRSGTASRTLTVSANVAPVAVFGQLFTMFQPAAGGPVIFTASSEDPENPQGRYVSHSWSVLATPPGETLLLMTAAYAATQGLPSGPGTYTVRLDVTDQAGATLTETQSFMVDVSGFAIPAAGQIGFSTAAREVTENSGSFDVVVRRTGGSAGSVSARLVLKAGTAFLFSDYRGFDGAFLATTTLSWADGDTSDRVVSIQLVDDTASESREQFSIQLNNPTGGSNILGSVASVEAPIVNNPPPTGGGSGFEPVPPPGGASNHVLTVLDNDGAGHATLLAAASVVYENEGNAVFNVRRSGTTSGTLTVNYSAANGTAIVWQDYTPASGTLTWKAGESADKQITVPLLNEGSPEGDENFTVTLTGAAPMLGSIKKVTATLRDAPYQQWQKTYWPGSFLLPPPTYSTTLDVLKSQSPLFLLRFSELAGPTVAGVDASGATVTTGTLTTAGSGTWQLNQVGPRPNLWPGLESGNSAVTTNASGSTATPPQHNAGAYISLGSANGLGPKLRTGFTFSAFVKTSITNRVMYLVGANRTTGMQFAVMLNRDTYNATATVPHALRLYLRSDSSSSLDYSVIFAGLPTGSLCDGQWHHIAISLPAFAGTIDNQEYPRFYFDGVEANVSNVRGTETIDSNHTFADFATSGTGVRLGANGATSVSAYFAGSFDEVAFFPSVLTPETVLRLATAGPLALPPSEAQPTANPANDGLINLLKYSLGLNPLLPEVLAIVPEFVTVGDQEYLAITYPENVDATDVANTVEVSGDLLDWESGPAHTTLVDSIRSGNIRMVTVRDNTPYSGGATSKRFIRVRVQGF